ncbi:hypothetical protein [Erwinia persicina]|nr:hypothetical protein [Erwinia persicina]
MNTSPFFLRFGTLLTCPAWVRVGLTAILVILLVMLTVWAAN